MTQRTGTILDKILDKKRLEVERHKRETPLAALEARIRMLPPPIDFARALVGQQVRLIAEVKKASPSRGIMAPNYDPVGLATFYAGNGAAAISVLTEADFFLGSLKDLEAVKAAVGPKGLPVLRKDFLYDAYQMVEARAHGADAALLIVAMLTEAQLREMMDAARSVGLQPLVEVHNEAELELALGAGAEVIGINHRDLKAFTMDMGLALRLRPLIPTGKIVVAESGMNKAADIVPLKEAGVNAILVGEALVTSGDTAAKVREMASV
ncbi:MAG: indole-3-glycerol phosphate synthase TrpC [SAR202 cluster bacterium]|nr:indole-3-glycerol phosphate synthase TrpC [SAR202 cluster bacterium]